MCPLVTEHIRSKHTLMDATDGLDEVSELAFSKSAPENSASIAFVKSWHAFKLRVT